MREDGWPKYTFKCRKMHPHEIQLETSVCLSCGCLDWSRCRTPECINYDCKLPNVTFTLTEQSIKYAEMWERLFDEEENLYEIR